MRTFKVTMYVCCNEKDENVMEETVEQSIFKNRMKLCDEIVLNVNYISAEETYIGNEE